MLVMFYDFFFCLISCAKPVNVQRMPKLAFVARFGLCVVPTEAAFSASESMVRGTSLFYLYESAAGLRCTASPMRASSPGSQGAELLGAPVTTTGTLISVCDPHKSSLETIYS